MSRKVLLGIHQQRPGNLQIPMEEYLLANIQSLQRLKQKLPDKNDHIIIDWSVNKLLAKMREGDALFHKYKEELNLSLGSIKHGETELLFEFLKLLKIKSSGIEQALEKGKDLIEDFAPQAIDLYCGKTSPTPHHIGNIDLCAKYFEDLSVHEKSEDSHPEISRELANKLRMLSRN